MSSYLRRSEKVIFMKITPAILILLLLATTLAMGQQAPMTFPQAANPSLVNGERYLPLITEPLPTPIAMASNEERTFEEQVLAWHHEVELGSPMPTSASPLLGVGTKGLSAPSGKLELGSSFPMGANPAR
jgi:hypothetical protein